MADYAVERAGARVETGLREVARAIDRHTESRAEIARQSISNMSDEKLERLERVVNALLRLQETGE